jgi:Cu(I)/Ag(I) efflux system membrane fusion protein
MHKIFHAGIQVEPVRARSLPVPLTLPGKVAFNERRRAHITARVGGHVENVLVYANEYVKAGQPLVELYSQEFQAMQYEFLQAAQRLSRAQEAGDEVGSERAIFNSIRRKLMVAGATEDDLAELESTRLPATHYVVRAPFSGTILESAVRLGATAQTGTGLFDIADLSTLWILADIYEKDLARIHTGMPVTVEVTAYPDRFAGRIATVYSVVDEKTRTVKARVEVTNKGLRLKPEMFCTVDVQTEVGKKTIKIPASALLGETERHFVFVALNDSTFERRDVHTGVETREFAEILDGLLEGERIVVTGGFFLKSELARETFSEEH